jgi:hypothetical protein
MNYLPGLALNHHPPDLCPLSIWDYRREPLTLAWFFFIIIFLVVLGVVLRASCLLADALPLELSPQSSLCWLFLS